MGIQQPEDNLRRSHGCYFPRPYQFTIYDDHIFSVNNNCFCSWYSSIKYLRSNCVHLGVMLQLSLLQLTWCKSSVQEVIWRWTHFKTHNIIASNLQTRHFSCFWTGSTWTELVWS
jgi:hypothetical protein